MHILLRPSGILLFDIAFYSNCRILEIVKDVLDVVEVAPDKPFEFSSPQFGVRVENPPADLGEKESFVPNLTTLLNQIMSSRAEEMDKEDMPEIPSAEVALSSDLIKPKEGGSQPTVSTSVFVTDKLFQQRNAYIKKGNVTDRDVGGIILDISVRAEGRVQEVNYPRNSNIVKPKFTKSLVSALACNRQSGGYLNLAWLLSCDRKVVQTCISLPLHNDSLPQPFCTVNSQMA